MRICRLRLSNFRGIKEGVVDFGQHTVVVGPNNSGKTTVIEALALVFGRDRMIRELTEHDFYGSDPSHTDRILLTATITDFGTNSQEDHPNWFGPDRAIPKWLDPSSGVLHSDQDDQSWKLCAQIGFAARFVREELRVETLRFFVDSQSETPDVFDDTQFQRAPWEAIKEFGFFLVSGARTWDRMMSFASELFRRVVLSIGGLPADAIIAERDRARKPTDRLEQQDGLKDVVEAANEELARLLSHSPELSLNLTATDSKAILDAITPHFRDKAGNLVPASRQGTGILSLQSLLLLLQFGNARAIADQGFCLGIEEPELHIAPAQQRRLVNRLQALCTQTIASTHSPTVASMYSTDSVVFLRNEEGQLQAKTLTESPLDSDTTNPIQKLFYASRSKTIAALMHQIVLIPEGRTDFGWLSYLSTAIELQESWNSDVTDGIQFGTFIGVIPTNDSHVVQTHKALARVHERVCCVVDGDAQGETFVTQLLGNSPSPPVIVIWPKDWSVEQLIAWLAEGSPDEVLPRISAALSVEISSSVELSDALGNAFKHWDVMHEAIANELAVCSATRKRTKTLLVELTAALEGRFDDCELFSVCESRSTESTRVVRFSP